MPLIRTRQPPEQLWRDGNNRLARLIDYFSLALIHGLLVVMLVRLSSHPELDREQAADKDEPSDA